MNAPHDTCHMKSTAYFSGMLGSQNSNKKPILYNSVHFSSIGH